MASWLRDAFEETLLLEGRVPRTLGRLAWPPGELTMEWRRGRRAPYVHPFRLYLLAAAVFFVPWTTSPSGGLIVGFLVHDTMRRAGALPTYERTMYLPAAPLSPTEAADPAARDRWRADFEERRAEARTRSVDADARVMAGVQRVTDLLPLIVGVLLVPVLAAITHFLVTPRPWSRAPARAAPAFMEHMVLSAHAHAVGYLVLGVLVMAVWAAGSPDIGLLVWPVGFALATAWLTVALRVNFGGGRALVAATVVLVPILYIAAFWTVSRAAILLLVRSGVIA